MVRSVVLMGTSFRQARKFIPPTVSGRPHRAAVSGRKAGTALEKRHLFGFALALCEITIDQSNECF
jgi:hypothetical protein